MHRMVVPIYIIYFIVYIQILIGSLKQNNLKCDRGL